MQLMDVFDKRVFPSVAGPPFLLTGQHTAGMELGRQRWYLLGAEETGNLGEKICEIWVRGIW